MKITKLWKHLPINEEAANSRKGAVIGSATEKPTMEKYGYHSKCGFDDDESGWMFEGGEDAYYEALKKWEDAQ